jgi:hypothetical protein
VTAADAGSGRRADAGTAGGGDGFWADVSAGAPPPHPTSSAASRPRDQRGRRTVRPG